MKKIIVVILLLSLSACARHENKNTITVGTIAGPETELMQVAKKVALKQFHLNIRIVTFNDYVLPNQALHDGEIDANAFQHQAYLNAQNRLQNFKLIAVAKTFLYPMALYSRKIKTLSQLKMGNTIAIPNDPSNEARALLLLQSAHCITINPHATLPTTSDITDNPKKLKFLELDGASLPRTLTDVTAAAINTTFAKPAGLKLGESVFIENTHSPYTNLIVTTPEKAHSKKIKELIRSFQSQAVINKAKQLFGSMAIAGFKSPIRKV